MIIKILLVLIFSVSSFAADNCQHDEKTFRCVEYVKNYDGDTVTFNIKDVHPLIGKNISVRVLGVDTPEIKGKTFCEKQQAKVVKTFVERTLLKAKTIEITEVQKDKYFRLLGDVKADGKSLKEMLINEGYAYPYFGDTKQKIDWCKPLRKPASLKAGVKHE